MSTERSTIQVAGTPVEVVRKEIKNLHLAVYPPRGHVRVAVPVHLDDDAVRIAVASRMGWIRRQQKAFGLQSRQSEREMVTGESHYLFGRRYRLQVIEDEAAPSVTVQGNTQLVLRVRPGTPTGQRAEVLAQWYRRELKERATALVQRWESILGVNVAEWGIRRMKTRWGTCNPEARRILLNLELAKKAPECLEYIVVHELVHLVERRHNDRFQKMMDAALPHWRRSQAALNRSPLAHEDWKY